MDDQANPTNVHDDPSWSTQAFHSQIMRISYGHMKRIAHVLEPRMKRQMTLRDMEDFVNGAVWEAIARAARENIDNAEHANQRAGLTENGRSPAD